MERAWTANEAKERFVSKMQEQFEKNPKMVERYGYSIDNFHEEVKQELHEIEQSKAKINEEYEKFNELKQASITSVSYQENLLDMEFAAVYENTDKFSYQEKYFAMQMLKDYNVLLPEDQIQTEMTKQNKYSEYNRNYTPTWKQAKDLTTSINIYDRTINKLRQADINNLSPKALKDTIIKIDNYRNLKANYEEHLKDIEPAIDANIDRLFENEHLNSASLDVKIAALEAYEKLDEAEQNELDVESFVQDLQEEQQRQAQYLEQKGEEDREHKDIYQDTAKKAQDIAGSLLDILKQLGQERQSMSDRQNRDRTKVFRRKGADGREL